MDINEAELIRTYHGWFWDDRLTQMLDPGDIFSGQPAHMAAGADYHRTRGDSEWALTHYIARLRATSSGGAAQRTPRLRSRSNARLRHRRADRSHGAAVARPVGEPR